MQKEVSLIKSKNNNFISKLKSFFAKFIRTKKKYNIVLSGELLAVLPHSNCDLCYGECVSPWHFVITQKIASAIACNNKIYFIKK